MTEERGHKKTCGEVNANSQPIADVSGDRTWVSTDYANHGPRHRMFKLQLQP